MEGSDLQLHFALLAPQLWGSVEQGRVMGPHGQGMLLKLLLGEQW